MAIGFKPGIIGTVIPAALHFATKSKNGLDNHFQNLGIEFFNFYNQIQQFKEYASTKGHRNLKEDGRRDVE